LQLEPKNITRVYTKTKCIVRENINGEIQIIVNEKVIPYTEIDPYKVQIKKAEHRRKINAKKELEKEERAKIRQEERHRLSKERKEK
jgi:DNA/RNA endonuclease G (NUC1)